MRSLEVTPSGKAGRHSPGTDVHPAGVAMVTEDAGGSDVSQSSREQTDASSIDSLDVSPVEKPRLKRRGRWTLKDTVYAILHKRRSEPTQSTQSNDCEAADTPETSRRSSAPADSPPTSKANPPSAGKPDPPAPGTSDLANHTGETEGQSALAPKPPARTKRSLHACKSDSGAITPTADDPPPLLNSCGRLGKLDVPDQAAAWEGPQTAPVLPHKTEGMKFMRHKISHSVRPKITVRHRPVDGGDVKVRVVDLSSENVSVTPSVLKMTYSELLQFGRSSLTGCDLN